METDTKGDLKKQLLERSTSKVNPELENKVMFLRKEEIMKRMQTKYQKYFKQWRDFDMLTTILAMIGLILAIVEVSYRIPSETTAFNALT